MLERLLCWLWSLTIAAASRAASWTEIPDAGDATSPQVTRGAAASPRSWGPRRKAPADAADPTDAFLFATDGVTGLNISAFYRPPGLPPERHAVRQRGRPAADRRAPLERTQPGGGLVRHPDRGVRGEAPGSPPTATDLLQSSPSRSHSPSRSRACCCSAAWRCCCFAVAAGRLVVCRPFRPPARLGRRVQSCLRSGSARMRWPVAAKIAFAVAAADRRRPGLIPRRPCARRMAQHDFEHRRVGHFTSGSRGSSSRPRARRRSRSRRTAAAVSP